MNDSCRDCRFYLPVDVFSGICKITKNKILPDDLFCDRATRLPKCKFCVNYSMEREHLGKCMGSAIAYPDMVAAKCADFGWSSPN